VLGLAGMALCALVFGLPSPAAAALPECTSIPVSLTSQLDSSKAKAGDVFTFSTVDTIIAKDGTRISSGLKGYGIVNYAVAAGAHGKGGELIVEARYIALPGGRQFQVSIDALATAVVHNGSTGSVNSGLASIPLPFMGTAVGAFNYFHSGQDAVVKTGTRFVVTPVTDLSHGKTCLQGG